MREGGEETVDKTSEKKRKRKRHTVDKSERREWEKEIKLYDMGWRIYDSRGTKRGQEVAPFNFLREIEERKKKFCKDFRAFQSLRLGHFDLIYSRYSSNSIYYSFVIHQTTYRFFEYSTSLSSYACILTYFPTCIHNLLYVYRYYPSYLRTYFPLMQTFYHGFTYLHASHVQILPQCYIFSKIHYLPHKYSPTNLHIFPLT